MVSLGVRCKFVEATSRRTYFAVLDEDSHLNHNREPHLLVRLVSDQLGTTASNGYFGSKAVAIAKVILVRFGRGAACYRLSRTLSVRSQKLNRMRHIFPELNVDFFKGTMQIGDLPVGINTRDSLKRPCYP